MQNFPLSFSWLSGAMFLLFLNGEIKDKMTVRTIRMTMVPNIFKMSLQLLDL